MVTMIPIKEYSKEQIYRICNEGTKITEDVTGYASLTCVDNNKALKLYNRKRNEDNFIGRDIETLMMIRDNVAQFDEHYLVPTEIVVCEGLVEGYFMPCVKGKRLSQAVKTSSIDTVFKWFEKIYEDILII